MTFSVNVQRQWKDFRVVEVNIEDLKGLHWTQGGVRVPVPKTFLHGYDVHRVHGPMAHSCEDGRGPHEIKVVVFKKDNDVWTHEEILKRFKAYHYRYLC